MQRTIPFHQKSQKILYNQTKKLYLQTKIDQINQKFKQNTLTKTQTLSQSQLNVQNKALQLQSYINKELNNIEYQKVCIRQYLQEIQAKQLKKQKILSEMSQYRKLGIIRLKKQIQLLIDLKREQSDEFLRNIQLEFSHKIKQQERLLKTIKKYWKSNLKKIINQIQGQSTTNIKEMKQRLSIANAQYNKKVNSLQLQIALKIELLIEQCKHNNLKTFQRQTQLLKSVKDLQNSLKIQVQKEHLQFHDNRQKILLVFQEATQKVERKRIQKLQNIEKKKKQGRFNSELFNYRHQTDYK